MATEPVQSKKGLESEPPVSQDNKHSESEKNGKKINDLIDTIYAFMQKRCPDRKISESIAMTLSNQGIKLENMTKWAGKDLQAYLDTLNLGIIPKLAFKDGIEDIKKRTFNFCLLCKDSEKFHVFFLFLVMLFVLFVLFFDFVCCCNNFGLK